MTGEMSGAQRDRSEQSTENTTIAGSESLVQLLSGDGMRCRCTV